MTTIKGGYVCQVPPEGRRHDLRRNQATFGGARADSLHLRQHAVCQPDAAHRRLHPSALRGLRYRRAPGALGVRPHHAGDCQEAGGSVNDFIRIELVATPQGWIARIEDLEDYESDPMPTAYQTLEDVVKLLRQFYEAFSFLREEA